MKKPALFIFFLLTTTKIFSQHTISGHIVDEKDAALLLQDVEVFISELNRVEFSKEGGTYIIRNVGTGTMHLRFSKSGYKTEERTVSTQDSATVIDVSMIRSEGHQEELIHSASFTRLPERSPFAVSFISRDHLERKGTLNHFQSLNYEPGIDLISSGNNMQNPVLRGSSGNEIAIIQSGSKMQTRIFNDDIDFNVEESSSGIEIIKGPASLMYGSGAMGGVLVYHDEKLPEAGTTEGDVHLAYFSNTAGINGDAGVRGLSNKGIFYSVRFGSKMHASYVQGEGDSLIKNTENKLYAYNSGFQSSSAKATVGFMKNKTKASISFQYLDKKDEIIRVLSDSIIEFEDQEIQKRWEITKPSIHGKSMVISTENIFFIKKSQIKFNASIQNKKKDFQSDGFEHNFFNNHEEADAYNYDVKYVSDELNKFGYLIGVQGEANKRNYIFNSRFEEKFNSSGAYGILRYDLAKINLIAGARYDFINTEISTSGARNKYSDSKVSFSGGIAYHPVRTITIKANAGTGYSEEGVIVSGLEGENLELQGGVVWNNPSIDIGGEVFHNTVKNFTKLIVIDPYNSKITLTGQEFFVSIHPVALSWIELYAAYDIIHGKNEINDVELTYLPDDKLVGSLKFYSDHMKYLYHPFISFTVRNYTNRESSLDNYSLLDFNLGGSFKIGNRLLDVTIAMTNILDEQYNSNLSQLKNLQYPVYEMGRNISLQVRVPFVVKKNK